MSKDVSVHIVIVTHDSSAVLSRCLDHIHNQNIPITSLIIVDSGSSDISYLESLRKRDDIKLILTDNIGFAQANNLGLKETCTKDGIVLFLNPDAFLTENFIFNAVEVLNKNDKAAIVSGKLLGFDIHLKKETSKIDSAGIYRKWYGRWYDRGQGEVDVGKYNQAETVPAICGALMVCRMEALKQYDGEVFDSDFTLYKEDIELSVRLRRDGWKLVYDPALIAYHCRGWENKRKKMDFELRIMAAKNEVLLYQKHPSPYIIWALLKYCLVCVFRV